jgi:hypothetical protein
MMYLRTGRLLEKFEACTLKYFPSIDHVFSSCCLGSLVTYSPQFTSQNMKTSFN